MSGVKVASPPMDLLRLNRAAWNRTAPSGLEALTANSERVVGPVHGFHLGCYTVQLGAEYFGYAKVFVKRPNCVWDAAGPIGKVSTGPFDDSDQALEAVIHKSSAVLEDHRWSLLRRFLGSLRR